MQFLQKISNSPSNFFIVLLFNFVIGVALASVFNLKRIELLFFYITCFVLIFFLIIFYYNKKIRLVILGGIFVCLGILRFIISEPSNNNHNLIFYHDRTAMVEGNIIDEPHNNESNQKVILAVTNLQIVNLENSKKELAKGRVLLTLPLFPEYNFGDKLEVECSLAAPMIKDAASWNYEKYLQKEGIWSVCLNPKILNQEQGKGNFIYYNILKFKNYLSSQVNKLLPEPQASFLRGLLYGARGSIPPDLATAFNRTGTSHIIAISGFNITIIATALLALLRGFWIPRKKAFWVVVICLIFFVILTGASASVVRAGLMGLIILLAKQIGRPSQVSRILIFTACLMLLFNPRVLFFDVGFQLSFASTMGLIYISPILERYFIKFPTKFGIKESILSTLAAIIATTPLILYSFGRFSLIAPVANLLVLPVIPCTMALGFGAILTSVVYFPIGQIAAFITWLPLTYVIKVIEWLASFDWSSVELLKVPWWVLIIAYGVMVKIVFNFWKNYVKD